jgi:putative protease
MNDFIDAGLGDFRMEFVHQEELTTGQAASALRDFLDHQITVDELDEKFRETSPAGTTQGSLFIPHEFRNLVQIEQKLGRVVEPIK